MTSRSGFTTMYLHHQMCISQSCKKTFSVWHPDFQLKNVRMIYSMKYAIIRCKNLKKRFFFVLILLIWSWNVSCHCPSMDPAMTLQYAWHGPLYVGYIFAFHWRTKPGFRPNEGGPLCPQSPLIPFLLHRMQKYSQHSQFPLWGKGVVRVIPLSLQYMIREIQGEGVRCNITLRF